MRSKRYDTSANERKARRGYGVRRSDRGLVVAIRCVCVELGELTK